MKIKNWNKVEGYHCDVMGVSLILLNNEIELNYSTNKFIYSVSIFDRHNCSKGDDKLFKIVLSEMAGDSFDLSISDNNVVPVKIKRVIRKNELTSLDVFVRVVMNELVNNTLAKTYLNVIGLVQEDSRKKNKLKAVNGITNFNMPNSSSIQW